MSASPSMIRQDTGQQTQRAPMLAAAPDAISLTSPITSLEDLAALASQNAAPVLKVHIENDIHLVRLEPGQLEFRPGERAPRSLAADLAQKLKEWTGQRWMISLAREGGAPTLAEAKRQARDAIFDEVRDDPLVKAVLQTFPGAEIIAVREMDEAEIAAPAEESDAS